MTNPLSLSLQDLMYEYYRLAVPANMDPGATASGTGVITKGAGGGGSSNVTITGPVDGSGNVKTSVQGPLSAAGNVLVDSPQTAGKYNSIINSGTATAPAAGNSVVTESIATTGYYMFDVTVGFGGTAESTAINNFEFLNNGATSGNSILPVANVANTQSNVQRIYAQVTGGNSVSVNVISAGSAGSVYKATIIGTRIA